MYVETTLQFLVEEPVKGRTKNETNKQTNISVSVTIIFRFIFKGLKMKRNKYNLIRNKMFTLIDA